MMITMTNGDVLPAMQAIGALMTEKLPASLSFQVRQVRKALLDVQEDIEAVRKDLVEEYAERDDAGAMVEGEQPGTIRLRAEATTRMEQEWAELMAREIEIPVSLSVKAFGEREIEPQIFVALGPLLTE